MNDKRLLKLAEEVLHEVLRQGETSNQPFEALKSSQALNGKLKTKNLSADWHAALMDYGSLVLKGASGKMKRAKKEPGRTVGSRFIPNRIFRGRIVETLRDARRGLPFSELGRRVCLDWKSSEHKDWLKGILVKLEKDALLERRGANYALRQ